MDALELIKIIAGTLIPALTLAITTIIGTIVKSRKRLIILENDLKDLKVLLKEYQTKAESLTQENLTLKNRISELEKQVKDLQTENLKLKNETQLQTRSSDNQ